jgi:hypothetical protein
MIQIVVRDLWDHWRGRLKPNRRSVMTALGLQDARRHGLPAVPLIPGQEAAGAAPTPQTSLPAKSTAIQDRC